MKRFECRAILFDLDGVLVDSTSYVEDQWRRWAVSKGLPPEPFLAICHGRRALETIQLAAPHLDAAAEVAAFEPDDLPNRASIAPIDGAAALLQMLPTESWAVATSGTRATATARLRHAGLLLPRVLICAEDVRHGKPNPDVYLAAAAGLAAAPPDCVVIEDAPAGIQAARAAGMSVIALTTTHRAHELQADAQVNSLRAIHVAHLDHSRGGAGFLELLVLDS